MASNEPVTGIPFTEGFVDADGFRIRYMTAGAGQPVVALHGAGGLMLPRAYNMLAEQFRIIAFEIPGFGQSAVNERSRSMKDLAHTLSEAIAALGLQRFSLMGTSFGGRLALWQAIEAQEQIDALVLVSPAGIVPENITLSLGSQEETVQRMFVRPEHRTLLPSLDPAVLTKQRAFVKRVFGPNRDPELEDRLATLDVPTLVLFGTEDGIIPPEVGRIYREKMPRCYYVLVYDTAHAIVLERPEAYVSVVGDFLLWKEQFTVSHKSEAVNP